MSVKSVKIIGGPSKGDGEKRKYDRWIWDPAYRAHQVKFSGDPKFDSLQQPQALSGSNIPPPMVLSMRDSPGFFLGIPSGPGRDSCVDVPQGSEEHIIVAGGSGSGKSSGIAKPTLKMWGGAICATDVKGELSEFYKKLYQNRVVTRAYIIFDPMDAEGPSYDPFDWLLRDDETHLVSNIMDIVRAIIPILPDDIQPFWVETARGVFAAALLYYFKRELSFSEAIAAIMTQSVSTLCKTLKESPDKHIQIFLGEVDCTKLETLANIDRGLHNKLMLFAADPYISHAFRGKRECSMFHLGGSEYTQHLSAYPGG